MEKRLSETTGREKLRSPAFERHSAKDIVQAGRWRFHQTEVQSGLIKEAISDEFERKTSAAAHTRNSAPVKRSPPITKP